MSTQRSPEKDHESVLHTTSVPRFAVALALIAALPCAVAEKAAAAPAMAMRDPAKFIAKWDQSGKGRLSLGIVDNAAIVKFESLDANHTGHLTLVFCAGSSMQKIAKDFRSDRGVMREQRRSVVTEERR